MCLICSNIPSAPTCLEVRNSTVNFTEATDVPGTVAGAVGITLGENVFGAVGVTGDTDMYSITLGPGTYYVNMVGDEFGGTPLLDTFVSIQTTGGTFEDDDSGAGTYSFATFTLTATQTVYISAEAYSGVGDYYLQVVAADVPGNVSTYGYLDESITLTGVFNSGTDQDWFEVSLVAGTSYTVNMTTSISGDSGLVSLFNGAGTFVSSAFGSLQFTATATGTFFISAETQLTTTTSGTYTVDLNVGGGGGGSWDAPNLPEPLASIDWGHVVPDRNTATAAVTDINVFFVGGGQTFTDSEGTYTTSAWGTAEYNAAIAAFQNYENIANVNFNIVTTAAQADFFMVETSVDSLLGYFGVGGGTVTLGGTNYTVDGHGVFNSGGSGWNAGGLSVGGYGYVTLIHEIGHGMGLAHPHDNGGSSSIMGGVTGAFGSIGTSGLNQGIYTTMSYNDGYYSLYGSTGPGSNNYGWQGSLMALDIAVLQDNYGANTTFSNGANNYALDSANAIGTYYQCIWDTGGTDTISFAGAAAATINLNAATLTGTAAQGAGGFLSFVAGVYGGFTIANGVVIENATGGSGADTLIGNSAANTLNGGGGADVMRGGAGGDTYIVNVAGDLVNESIAGSNGYDRILSAVTISLSNAAQVLGAVESVTLTGTLAINATGNTLANLLNGNSAANTLNGATGADIMRGGAGGDTYMVDNAGDLVDESIAGSSGYDRILSSVTISLSNTVQVRGAVESVSLTGTAAINVTGNTLANLLNGNSAANTLNGATGADTMRGGAGGDTYVVDNVSDVVDESIAGSNGYDRILSSVTINLSNAAQVKGVVESVSLTGTAAINAIGNSISNILNGNSGSNVLDGGLGSDVLTGGGSNDVFRFSTAIGTGASSNIDTINDFTHLGDRLWLDNAIFSSLALGTLSAANLRIAGTGPLDGNDYLIYNSTNGGIYYDADANGGGAAVLFAVVTPGTVISAADFLVY